MRIPRKKLFRAFPELDSYPDEQCELFVRRVLVQTRYRLLRIIVLAAVFLGAGYGTILALSELTPHVLAFVSLRIGHHDADFFILAVWVFLLPAVLLLAPLLARDVLLRIYLNRVMRPRLDRIRCLNCKYILLGQRPVSGTVTCPECGTPNALHQLGIVADDLLLH